MLIKSTKRALAVKILLSDILFYIMLCYNIFRKTKETYNMNMKHFITLGLVAGFAITTASALAENSIYTDGIGRLHFLGRDVNDAKAQYNYTNPEQQDLTRRLYEGTSNEVRYVDHSLKNYDQTFGADRMDTQTMWKNKFQNNVNEAQVGTYHGSFGGGRIDKEDISNISDKQRNEVKTTEKKKHWWSK